MADNILVWYLSASVCHVRWCSLCVPFGVFISMQREAHPFLGMSKIKSATPLTAPSYFIRAPVLASRLPPLGTAKSIRASLGYCNRNHTKQSCCIWLSDNGVVCFLIFFR